MSSASEGWYVDPSTGKNLRFWNGTKWTDEVAPLPYEPTGSGPVDLLAAGRVDPYVAPPVGLFEGIEAAEAAEAQATAEAEAAEGESDAPILEPELELTLLTRRELRARSASQLVVDDAPKHLPPLAPPEAISVAEWEATASPLEIPAPAIALEATNTAEVDVARKTRIVRMSVLLGILAVATSVAVFTAGTI